MKPTSIIFIIISVVLIIAGFVTMSFAKQADTDLIATDAGSEFEETVGSDIYRIDIDVKNANIIINGIPANGAASESTPAETDGAVQEDAHAETSSDVAETPSVSLAASSNYVHVKLINFTEGMYKYQYSNRVLSIKDNYDLGTVSGVFSFITNFRGFRHYLNYHQTSELEKTIEIDVRGDISINCSVGEGNVTITGIRSSEDCTVKIEKGDLVLKDSEIALSEYTGLPKKGALDASIEYGNVTVEDGGFTKYTVRFGTPSNAAADASEEASDGTGSDKSTFTKSESLKFGAEYSIGEYNVETGFGYLDIKGDIAMDCTMNIRYDTEEKGTYSAAPNAAGTKFGVTERGGSQVIVVLECRDSIGDSTLPPPVTDEGSDGSQPAA